MSYKDLHWHEECFKCRKCKDSLVEKPFAGKNNYFISWFFKNFINNNFFLFIYFKPKMLWFSVLIATMRNLLLDVMHVEIHSDQVKIPSNFTENLFPKNQFKTYILLLFRYEKNGVQNQKMARQMFSVCCLQKFSGVKTIYYSQRKWCVLCWMFWRKICQQMHKMQKDHDHWWCHI